jgi:hypothetical protein
MHVHCSFVVWEKTEKLYVTRVILGLLSLEFFDVHKYTFDVHIVYK